MAYRHKSKPSVTCTVIDASDGYVIYQYAQDGLIITTKTWADDFLEEWEVSTNGSY